MNPASPIKKWADLVLVVAFALMLSLPALCSFGQDRKTKDMDEHRLLAAFPEIGLGVGAGSLQTYFRQAEKYFNDRFGCRQALIRCHLTIKHVVSPTELSSKAVGGRDGWLFYLGGSLIDDRLGAARFTTKQLQAWQSLLEKRRDWLAARGITYLFVIAPNKESVYSEFLPDWLQHAAGTKLDQFVDYMCLHTTVQILDLRPVLRAARKHDPVYYRTDSHWNLMGGFTADEAIILKISSEIPGLAPVGREHFKIQRESGTGGDLARLAGLPVLRDDNLYSFTPEASLLKLEFQASGTNMVDGRQWGTLPVPNIAITTINRQRTTKATLFGDSFAIGLAPFIGCHFGEVTILQRDALDSKTISHDKPVLVISEMLERNLDGTDPLTIADHLEVQ